MTDQPKKRHYQSWGECSMHKTKHYATISTGTTLVGKDHDNQLRNALAEDLRQEYPWCHKTKSLAIKFEEYKIPEIAHATN